MYGKFDCSYKMEKTVRAIGHVQRMYALAAQLRLNIVLRRLATSQAVLWPWNNMIVWSKEQTALTSCVDPESIKLYPVGGGCNIKSKEAWSGSVSLFKEHNNNALEPLTKN